MMFGRKKIKSLEKDIENLCDIIEAKEDDIHTLVMEPESEKASKVKILYKIYYDGMKHMWAGDVHNPKPQGIFTAPKMKE